jgi:putative inorganic carbon (hco3(-)) transporter
MAAAYVFSAALACSVFSSHWGEFLPGVPVPPDRALLALALALVALRRLRGEGPVLAPRGAHWLLAATLAWAVVSAWAAGTLGDSEARFVLLDRLGVVPFVAFAAAPLVFTTARERAILLATLVGLGGYLSLTALFEALGEDSLVYPRYIADPAVGIHFGRARGPFADATVNGVALFACGVACTIAAATWRRPPARLAAGAIGVLCVVGVVATLQRSVWLGASAATIVALAAAPRLRRLLVPALACAAALVGGALMLVPGLAQNVQERRSAVQSVWDRRNLLGAGLRMVEERPLLGFGWHRFTEASPAYLRQSDDIPLTDEGEILHNVYLSNAVELGLAGAALWLLALAVCVGGPMLARGPPELGPWRAGLVAIAAMWVVVATFSPLVRVFPNLILWTWAGVVAVGPLQLASRRARAQAAGSARL